MKTFDVTIFVTEVVKKHAITTVKANSLDEAKKIADEMADNLGNYVDELEFWEDDTEETEKPYTEVSEADDGDDGMADSQ